MYDDVSKVTPQTAASRFEENKKEQKLVFWKLETNSGYALGRRGLSVGNPTVFKSECSQSWKTNVEL